MSEDDHLSVATHLGETTRNLSFPLVIEGRHRIIKHHCARMARELELREKCAEGNSSMLPFAQDLVDLVGRGKIEHQPMLQLPFLDLLHELRAYVTNA